MQGDAIKSLQFNGVAHQARDGAPHFYKFNYDFEAPENKAKSGH